MKILSLFCIALILAEVSLAVAAEAPGTMSKGLLRHVVSFKFKDTASAGDIKKVTDAFRDLKSKIPGVVDYEWGTNASPEHLNQGFTHCFILSFKSEKDRDAYLVHPDHKAFGKLLGPFLDKVFVIDFWAKD